MTTHCQKDGCPRTWDRDPAVEVACPTCSADVGVKCRRPSGHGGNFVHPHAKRDLLALEEGHYGECPSGRCSQSLAEVGVSKKEEPAPAGQLTLGEVGQ